MQKYEYAKLTYDDLKIGNLVFFHNRSPHYEVSEADYIGIIMKLIPHGEHPDYIEECITVKWLKYGNHNKEQGKVFTYGKSWILNYCMKNLPRKKKK